MKKRSRYFKKLCSLGFVIVLMFSISIVNLYHGGTPAKAETGFQWIQGAGVTIIEDKLGLTGDAHDEALAQYEANTGVDPFVGSFMIGKNCDDTDTLEDGLTPVCEEYYTFAKSLGVNPPYFQEVCRLSDSCGEPESIALLNYTTGCRIVPFSGAPRICTTKVTINNPFNIRRRAVTGEFSIDFSAITRLTS